MLAELHLAVLLIENLVRGQNVFFIVPLEAFSQLNIRHRITTLSVGQLLKLLVKSLRRKMKIGNQASQHNVKRRVTENFSLMSVLSLSRNLPDMSTDDGTSSVLQTGAKTLFQLRYRKQMK